MRLTSERKVYSQENVFPGATFRSTVSVFEYNYISQILDWDPADWQEAQVPTLHGGMEWLCFTEHCGTEEKQIKPWASQILASHFPPTCSQVAEKLWQERISGTHGLAWPLSSSALPSLIWGSHWILYKHGIYTYFIYVVYIHAIHGIDSEFPPQACFLIGNCNES